MGDSAGGLLSMNLLNYIIRKKYTKPKAMILIYPCKILDLFKYKFFESC